MSDSRRWFIFGILFEGTLLALAAVISLLFGRPMFQDLQLSARHGLLGCLGSVPLLALFWYLLGSSHGALSSIREFLESHLRPAFEKWSLIELALISILAGVGEEALFRGVIQGGLAKPLGQPLAVVLASVVFGLCHFVNAAYAVVAACIGGYLGVLWLVSGNLLTPIVTHAVYDFVALVCFLRVMGRNHHPSA